MPWFLIRLLTYNSGEGRVFICSVSFLTLGPCLGQSRFFLTNDNVICYSVLENCKARSEGLGSSKLFEHEQRSSYVLTKGFCAPYATYQSILLYFVSTWNLKSKKI